MSFGDEVILVNFTCISERTYSNLNFEYGIQDHGRGISANLNILLMIRLPVLVNSRPSIGIERPSLLKQVIHHI